MTTNARHLFWSDKNATGTCSVEDMLNPYVLQTKPVLGFEFSELLYEPLLETAKYVTITDEGIQLNMMTPEQVAACDKFIAKTADLYINVYAYDPNRSNVYVGMMTKGLAVEKQLSFSYRGPDHESSRFIPATGCWEQIYACIGHDGRPILQPVSIPLESKKFFTKEEWEQSDGFSNLGMVWDDTTQAWKDPTDLDTKVELFVNWVGHLCGAARVEAYGRQIHNYEQSSWPVKYREAKEWKRNPQAPTPYFDLYNQFRDRKVTKEQFMDNILENDATFRKITAIVDAVQWNYFDKARAVTTAEELSAIEKEFAQLDIVKMVVTHLD